MASELIFYGRKFLPSGEASRVSGYSTDYIGQLCRGEKLVCRRVGRSWFVEEMSLLAYTALDLNHAPSKVFRLNGNRASTEVRAEAPTSVVVPAAELVSAGVFAQSLVAEAPAGGESSPAMAPVKELVELIPTANTLSQAEEVAPAAPVAEKIPTHSPVSPSVEIIADRVLENLADGWGFLRHQFSPELGQKALVLGLSVALVFGPYFVRNQTVLQTVGELVRASSQNIAAQIGGASEALQSLASASPEELRQAFSLTAVSLVSRRQNLGEMLFESGARAAGEAREGGKEDGRLLAEGAAESVRAFAVLVADRYESFSLQAAGLLLMTKESLLSFNNPIDDLARGVYRGVNKGIFSLRDPIRRFLGIKDGSGGTTATTGVSTSTSITKFVYTSPSTKAEPPYRYIPPAPVIESVIERQIVISPANIEQKLFDLQTRLATDISSLLSTTAEVQSATQSNATYINNVYNTVAQTNNLDRVEDLTLLNPKISFGTMTSTALSAVSGTFTALSGNSLTVDSLNGTTCALTGNLTVGGNATIAGNLDVYGTVTPATISATSSVSAPYFTATSTTATSSFAGGLTVQTDKFVVESGSGDVGLGTTSPQARLALSGYADSANPLLLISTSTPSATSTALIITSSGNFGLSTSSPTSRFAIEASTPTAAFLLNQTGTGNLLTLEDSGTAVFSVVDGGNVGVGTTSPFAKLSVSGAGYFDGSITTASSLTAGGDITATNITATRTATFTNLLFHSRWFGPSWFPPRPFFRHSFLRGDQHAHHDRYRGETYLVINACGRLLSRYIFYCLNLPLRLHDRPHRLGHGLLRHGKHHHPHRLLAHKHAHSFYRSGRRIHRRLRSYLYQRQPPHRNICFLHLAHHERVRGVRDRRRQCRHRDDFARGKALRQRRLNGNGNVSCGLRQRHGRYVQNLHLHAHRHLQRFCD